MIIKFFHTNLRKNSLTNQGLTLIEIILSFAILSIVLSVFLNLFSDAGKDNLSVSYKSKAVYMAQSYMEMVYEGSTEHSYNTYHSILTADDPEYNFVWNSVNAVYEKTDDDYFVRIKITFQKMNLYKVLVQVYDNSQTELLAQNESAFIFKE